MMMLARQNILTEAEKEDIIEGLEGILSDVENGKLPISEKIRRYPQFCRGDADRTDRRAGKEAAYRKKPQRPGGSGYEDVCKKARSASWTTFLRDLLQVLLSTMEENLETYMPGFTHLQKAQPVTLAHHLGAYFEMFKRDHERLKDLEKRMNTCPLGSGALAGTTYPLDGSTRRLCLALTGRL